MTGLENIIRKFRGNAPAGAVLMYHHIRDTETDPWETTVSEKNFRAHLQVLGERYEVLPLTAGCLRPGRKTGKRKKIFITFDDGYLDNYEAAVPALRRYGFPATFFIPSRILQGREYFWWEMVDHLFWGNEDIPGILELRGSGGDFIRRVPPEARGRNFQAERIWSANHEPPPTMLCGLYLELCGWIKERPVTDQEWITEQLLDICSGSPGSTAGKMSAGQIRRLAAEGFGIGSHTIHHPALGAQTPEVQAREIRESKSDLETATGRPVSTIAYPHGHFNDTTVTLAKDAGYSLACTTETGYLHKNSHPFMLPRVWAKNTDGMLFQQTLSNLFKH